MSSPSKDDGLLSLLLGLTGGDPSDGIVASEKAGQAELVASTVLPSDMQDSDGRKNREVFEALGFVFGDVVADDPMWIEATLPDGWKKVRTDHDMWSGVVDTRGIEMVSVFYKAAFYDRSAFMRISDPGYRFASSWIYADAVEGEQIVFPDFTDDEFSSVWLAAANYLGKAKEHPDIYGDRKDRAQQLFDAVIDR